MPLQPPYQPQYPQLKPGVKLKPGVQLRPLNSKPYPYTNANQLTQAKQQVAKKMV